MRGQRRRRSFTASPKFSDGTGREPAVAEMSRSVTARTALSFCSLDGCHSTCTTHDGHLIARRAVGGQSDREGIQPVKRAHVASAIKITKPGSCGMLLPAGDRSVSSNWASAWNNVSSNQLPDEVQRRRTSMCIFASNH
jgi:hypothetical protein